MTDNTSSSSSGVEHLETELSSLEQFLETPRSAGRAAFDSVRSSLLNLRSRVDEALATNSGIQHLRQRLTTAELAHSSRRPLEAVRQHQQQTTIQQNDPARLLQQDPAAASPPLTPRRNSLLMASRARSAGSVPPNEDMFSVELHRATQQAAKRARKNDDEKEEDIQQDISEEVHLETVHSTESDCLPILPARVLLTRSQSHESAMANPTSISGSIVHWQGGSPTKDTSIQQQQQQKEQLPGSLVYSWGLEGLASLHDDEQERTPGQAKLSSDSRLGKPNVPALVSVATGIHHSACATASGSLYVCGNNEKGCVDPLQQGVKQYSRPTLLEAVQRQSILQVGCGLDHTAAVTATGTVLTWGSNQHGQLGHRQAPGNSFCSPQGMVLGTDRRAAAVACGHYFTLVLTTRMCVLACGVETIATPKGATAPCVLPALQGLPVVFVAAGHNHAVVLTSSGAAYAWGLNDSGCCGRSYPPQLNMPVEMHVPEETKTTVEGTKLLPSSSCTSSNIGPTSTTALTRHQQNPFRNWAWQDNAVVVGSSGGAMIDPIRPFADDVAAMHAACGESHTVLVTRSGRLLVCGSNRQGQLGLPQEPQQQSSMAPVYHPNGRSFVSAEAGNIHTLLLDSDGNVWQMGGDLTSASSSGPQCVLQGKNILSIAAGGYGNNIALAPGAAIASTVSHRRRHFSITADLHDNNDNCPQANSLALANNLDELVGAMVESGSSEVSTPSREMAAAIEIAKRTEELLQNPAVMNSLSFGPSELDRMYTTLMSIGDNPQIQQTILSAIEKGISKGLDALSCEAPRMIYPEAVRCLLVYIRFFDRPTEAGNEDDLKFDIRGKLISNLMETILSLPFEGYKAFLQWATSIYKGDLFIKMLVQPLLYQLEKSSQIKLEEDGVIHTSISVGAVPLIVSVLQWLYNASERLGIVQPEAFICKLFDKVPSHILYADLYELKRARNTPRGVTMFHISESPFLFSPSTKRGLLKIENQIEMYNAVMAEGITQSQVTAENAFFTLEIDRDHMLEQTLATIKQTKPSDLRKSLKVKFTGEEGVDAGGVTKEFFQLLSEELFDVSSGMWTDKYGDDITWFNSNCMWEDVGFELTGVLVGLALYNSVLLDVHFPMAVYRKLLGYPLGLEDMVDLELKRGFRQLLDYDGDDVEDIFCLNFEVSWTDDLGEERKRELKPGGSDIPVTSDNREEYVRLYVSWLLIDSIYPQWQSFESGVARVMHGSSIDMCRPEELELLVVGSPVLDFDALEENTHYEGGYSSSSETIQSFWRYIKSIDRESQTNFLKFATGSPKAPIGGLGELPFKIQRAGPDSPQLPTSHTCFNTLILPDYGNDEKLAERLGRAIVECEGFGLQ